MKVYDRLNATEEQDLTDVTLDASALERLEEPGEGSLTVPAEESVGYRKVVRLQDRFEFRVTKAELVRVHETPESRTLQVSGPGLLSWLQETLLLPFTGDGLPQPAVRHFGWPDPAIDAETDWDDTLYVQPRDDVIASTDRPSAWMDAFSVWIHTRPPYTSHPAETVFLHREVETSGPHLNLYSSASDQFELAWDAAIVQVERLTDPTDNTIWPYTWRARLRDIPAGTHTLRVKLDVINATGAGGFIGVGFETSEISIVEPIFATGINTTPGAINGGWHATTVVPGRTATDILATAIAEAGVRGCDVPTLTFTATHDSASQAMPLLEGFSIAVPCTLWDLARALGLELRWSGWTLDAFASRGSASGKSWTDGVDVLEHRIVGQA